MPPKSYIYCILYNVNINGGCDLPTLLPLVIYQYIINLLLITSNICEVIRNTSTGCERNFFHRIKDVPYLYRPQKRYPDFNIFYRSFRGGFDGVKKIGVTELILQKSISKFVKNGLKLM